MLRAVRESGWYNYSPFLRDDGLLVGYLESPGTLAQAQHAMAAADVNARWQGQMAPFFVELDGVPDSGFVQLTEVFNLDDQLTATGEAPTPRS